MAGPAIKLVVEGRETTPLALAFQGRLTEVIGQKLKVLEAAYPRAMAKGVTQPGKKKLRATIEASGFYRASAFAKVWRGITYPAGRPTLEPAAVFNVGKKGSSGAAEAATIISAFEDGVTITVHNAQYLAIPEGPAKGVIHSLNRGRAAAGRLGTNEAGYVERVAQALGTTLIPIIDEKRGLGVLVAASGARLTRTGRMAKNQTGKATVLFVLVRHARLKKRPMGRAVLGELQAGFLGAFAAALAAELGSEDA